METKELRAEIAVLNRQKDGCCIYCHRRFGSLVTWRKRNRYLEEVAAHVIPECMGGKLTVPCCQICNAIQGSLRFESLADIQDYCLDRLIKDGSVTVKEAHFLRVERNVTSDELTEEEISIWWKEEKPIQIISKELEEKILAPLKEILNTIYIPPIPRIPYNCAPGQPLIIRKGYQQRLSFEERKHLDAVLKDIKMKRKIQRALWK